MCASSPSSRESGPFISCLDVSSSLWLRPRLLSGAGEDVCDSEGDGHVTDA